MLSPLMFDALLNAAHGYAAFTWGTTDALFVDRMAGLTLFRKEWLQYPSHVVARRGGY